ncbi:MAG TPA: 2-hydroxyacid dehydrogenase [Rhodopila sp.]|jgi:phosphoglycerate dehydrogenase-like enzyme
MRIVFHGQNAAAFSGGFAALVGQDVEVVILPDVLASAADQDAFASADVIIGTRFDAKLPRPRALLLFHVPGAGYDSVDLDALPVGVTVCNCFGHEHAIAEYVMAALLRRYIPLTDADQRLRQGDWRYSASLPGQVHREMSGSTLGILGFGHIGKAVAARAAAFGVTVHVANRGKVVSDHVDRSFGLDELARFWGDLDNIVVTLPLVPETRGIVGAEAFARMRPDAVLINVARGPVVDEQALYDALHNGRIGGAVIDTWYQYPSPGGGGCMPSKLPFHELTNVVMTPHMSGWTDGTIRRRQQVIADNIRRRLRGEACVNVVRS